MQLPDFINAFPRLAIPLPEDQVSARAIRSDAGLTVFFTFHKDVSLPAHSHGPQWGSVLQGRVDLTIDGETRSYGRGESYYIQSGVEHAVFVPAGTVAIDVFEEADRYPLES